MESAQRDKGLIWGLLELASDTDKDVQRTVSISLITLGCKHPSLVLSSMHRFLDNPQTAPKAHIQSILYNAAEGIVKQCGTKIDDDTITEVWINDSKQLLLQPSVSLDLQQAASSLLTTLGCHTSNTSLVMRNLIDSLRSNSAPILSIIETLAKMASTNGKQISPYFKEILVKLIPCLAQVKQDNIRMGIASLIASFSEALIEAFASDDIDMSVDIFHDECAQVYEILVNTWLRNSSASVKNEIIEALGHMSYLLSSEKLQEFCSATIVAILGHYKRNPNTFTLTFSMALVCDAVIKKHIVDSLKPHLDSMLATLFSQVCISPNYNEPLTVKNFCEVLRCYEILGKKFPENVMAQIVQRLENASHVQRVGALLVTKHFINSHSLEDEHYARLITTLQQLLTDPNSKVVKSITQVIVALCHNSHLNSENGAIFITYLVQHSAGGSLTPARRTSLSEIGEEPVGDNCCRALNLLATTMPSSIPILWPHLLQYVNQLEYTESLPTLLSCLSHLSSLPETKPSDAGTIFKKLPSESSAPSILTRLMVLSCVPTKSSIGLHCLGLLGGLAKHVSTVLETIWPEHLPQLRVNFARLCTGVPEPISIQLWQDSLRDLLSVTIQEVNSDSFTNSLITAEIEQLEQNDKNQAYKSFIMTMVGITLRHCNNSNLISSTLDSVYSLANHKSSAEQGSFSMAVGLCASSHMGLVMSKIETWLRSAETSKRSLSLMSILKQQDTRSEEYIWVRSSIVQCLGQASSLAPPEVVGSQVDGPIMLHLLNIVNSNKNELVGDIILQTTSKICKALLHLPGFKLRQRSIFIPHIVNTMKQDNISTNTLAHCLQAMRDLVALEPEINIEERTTVLQASLSATFNKLIKSPTIDSELDRCYSQLNVLLRTVIQHDTNPATLDDVTTLLHHWTLSIYDIVRIRAVDLLHSSFCTYLQYLVLDHTSPTSFNQTCQLLSILTPRFSDPCSEVRTQSVTCAILILKITGRYAGQGPTYTDKDLNCLKSIESLIGAATSEDMKKHLPAIAEALSNKLTFSHLRLYLSLMVCGLQDKVDASACGVAQILSAILALRGHQFHQHIKEILDSIFNRLEKVIHVPTRMNAVEAVFNLSRHNVTIVCDAILNCPIPYEKGISEALSRLGADSDICNNILTHFIHILERTQPFTEQKTATEDVVQIATLQTLAVICAMKSLLLYLSKSGLETEEQALAFQENVNEFVTVADRQTARQGIVERFSSLCALLMLSFGSYIDAIAPLHQTQGTNSKNAFIPNRGATTLIPSKCALDALLALAGVVGCSQLEESLTIDLQYTNGETFDFFLHTVTTIIQLLVKEAPEHISSLVAYLDTHHSYDMQRVTVTAVFGQLVAAKCCGDYELLEIITQGLLSRLNDRSIQVRRLAVRGLANFAQLQNDQVSEKMGEILSALVAATDLRNEGDAIHEGEVALESLRGLSSLLASLKRETVLQHASTLLIRIRLFMEKRETVREAALGVLRGLALSVGDSDEFKEHCHLHLLGTIIHLEDPYPPMTTACKSVLQAMGPNLGCVQLDTLFKNRLKANDNLDFPSFVSDVAKYLPSVLHEQTGVFVQAAISYFRHTEPSIRKAAVHLIGNLIYHYGESLENGPLQRACSGLLNLMKDSDADVRSTAVLVIPFLFKHEKFL